MKLPTNRKMIGSAKLRNASFAGATPDTTARLGPINAVAPIGKASVIHNTTVAANTASNRCDVGVNPSRGNHHTTSIANGASNSPDRFRHRSNASSNGVNRASIEPGITSPSGPFPPIPTQAPFTTTPLSRRSRRLSPKPPRRLRDNFHPSRPPRRADLAAPFPARNPPPHRLSHCAWSCPSGNWNPSRLVFTDSACPSTWATLARPACRLNTRMGSEV